MASSIGKLGAAAASMPRKAELNSPRRHVRCDASSKPPESSYSIASAARSLAPNHQGRALALGMTLALEELDASVQNVRAAADPEHGEIRLAFLRTLGVRWSRN